MISTAKVYNERTKCYCGRPKYFVLMDDFYVCLLNMINNMKDTNAKEYYVHILSPNEKVTKNYDFTFCIQYVDGDITLFLNNDECLVSDIESHAKVLTTNESY
jgi:hypothetical protein